MPSIIESIRKHHGLSDTDRVGVKASLSQKQPEVNEPERLVTAIANTASIDMESEVVVPEGAEVDGQGRPVYFDKAKSIYWNHEHWSQPIGTLRNASLKNGMWVCQFRVTDKTQMGNEIFALIQEGAVNGVSIGFVAKDHGVLTESEVSLYGPAESIVRRWRWLELSVTPMPCNPEAWITAKSTGRVPLPDGVCSVISRRVGRGLCSKETAKMLGFEAKRRIVVV